MMIPSSPILPPRLPTKKTSRASEPAPKRKSINVDDGEYGTARKRLSAATKGGQGKPMGNNRKGHDEKVDREEEHGEETEDEIEEEEEEEESDQRGSIELVGSESPLDR